MAALNHVDMLLSVSCLHAIGQRIGQRTKIQITVDESDDEAMHRLARRRFDNSPTFQYGYHPKMRLADLQRLIRTAHPVRSDTKFPICRIPSL